MSDAQEPKKFSLKETESQLLSIIRNNNNSTFSASLSAIAIERLGYKVTQRTQFALNEDLTEVTIQELPEDVPTIPAEPTEPEAPASGAVAAK